MGGAAVAQATPACSSSRGVSTKRWRRGASASSHRIATPAPGQIRLTVSPSTTVRRAATPSTTYATANPTAHRNGSAGRVLTGRSQEPQGTCAHVADAHGTDTREAQ